MEPRSEGREALIRTTAQLLRTHGYAGTGVADVLAGSGLPKGSLYHHFPGGKAELALVATRRVADLVTHRIGDAFEAAQGFNEGVRRLCDALAELARSGGTVAGCPIAGIAQAGAEEPALRALAQAVLAEWTTAVENHARRLDAPDPPARARLVLMELQGAWAVAAIEGRCDAFASLREAWHSRA